MRAACLESIYELAKRDSRVVFIGSDIGAGTLEKFRRDMPDRFFMEGISEQAIAGMAAGMALEGKIVYVTTIATFITRRAFEQNVLDIALHNARVRLIGMGGGLVYAPLGPTHLAVDDIAIMRSIPGMTVIAPADAPEMRRMMALTLDHPGPVYVSVAKGGDPVVTPDNEQPAIGKGIALRHGRDALLVTTGICLGLAQEAAHRLEAAGMDAGILHLPTVKPFDAGTLLSMSRGVPVIVSVEERSLIGGLGSCVAECIADSGRTGRTLVARIGLPDVFPEGYGSQKEMMARYGLTPDHVEETVRMLVKRARAATTA